MIISCKVQDIIALYFIATNVRENIGKMEDLDHWKKYLTLQDYHYLSIMQEEAFHHLIFQCIMTIVHIFLVIPSNIFTLVVIVKNKTLWTPSNSILAINAVFMMIGSTAILFLRQAHFPLLLYGESYRTYANEVGWWVCTMTFRIGNNR